MRPRHVPDTVPEVRVEAFLEHHYFSRFSRAASERLDRALFGLGFEQYDARYFGPRGSTQEPTKKTEMTYERWHIPRVKNCVGVRTMYVDDTPYMAINIAPFMPRRIKEELRAELEQNGFRQGSPF